MDSKAVLKRSFLFIIVSLFDCNGRSSVHQELIIGKESGVCGNYYAVSENQTVAIQSTHRIDPSCMMGFFGYINHGNTSVLTVECLRIISVKLPCSSNSTNNIFLVRIFSLIPDYNGTVSIDKDMVLKEETFSCNESTLILPTEICSRVPHIFQIDIHVPDTGKSAHTTILLKMTKGNELLSNQLWYPHARSIAISNDMSNYPKLCLSDNGVCVHILPSKSNSEEKEENSLDINNMITIIVGSVTSLMVPVVILLIRKYKVKNGNSKTDEDTVTETVENVATGEK